MTPFNLVCCYYDPGDYRSSIDHLTPNIRGHTPLYLLCESGDVDDVDVVKCMLDNVDDLVIPDSDPSYDFTDEIYQLLDEYRKK